MRFAYAELKQEGGCFVDSHSCTIYNLSVIAWAYIVMPLKRHKLGLLP